MADDASIGEALAADAQDQRRGEAVLRAALPGRGTAQRPMRVPLATRGGVRGEPQAGAETPALAHVAEPSGSAPGQGQGERTGRVVEPPDPALLRKLDASAARELHVLPLSRTPEGAVRVATDRALDTQTRAQLSIVLEGPIEVVLVESTNLAKAIESAYERILSLGTSTRSEVGNPEAVRIVDELLEESVRMRASDIHIEPRENRVEIRFRIDGVLHTATELKLSMRDGVTSRIKILANLDFASRQPSQDGQITYKLKNRTVAYRVSTLRTLYGDNVVLRVLDTNKSLLTMEELGLEQDQQRVFRHLMGRTGGMLVVSGPTGSGKTTTLYAAIHMLDAKTRHVVSLEDPVEYLFDAVTQVPVEGRGTGLTFEGALMAVLRQDPDVIVVGETRTAKTAEIALSAAQTGHLVLTSFHAMTALATLTRLTELGIEPYLVAANVNGVVGQRLVRMLCPDCRAPHPTTPEEARGFRAWGLEPPATIMGAKGCNTCGGIGYRGRVGIYEILEMSTPLADALVRGGSTVRELEEAAAVVPMAVAGLEKVRRGETTVQEVLRVVGEI